MESSKTIKNLTLHSVTGKTDDSFVGIKGYGNDIHLYYPETYYLDKESQDLRQDIIYLLRTIAIAKSSTDEESRAYNTHTNDNEFALSSYLWVINDYLSRGFYVNREKVYCFNSNGRINWKRTMQAEPIVSGKNLVFKDFVVERKQNVDNILAEIHRFCVKKSIDYIGWVYNLESSFIETRKVTERLKSYYLYIFASELEHTFIDEKKLLLHHMKNVIIGLNEESNNKDFVYGVDDYYYIFERMVDSVFGNVSCMSDFYPSAKWIINDKTTDSSRLRPDTILLKDDDAYIIDSKYYRYGFTNDISDLPETSSIQKQITYGEFIRKNSKANTEKKYNGIYNVFILPYSEKNNEFSGCNLEYIGRAESTWKSGNESFEKIYAFAIEMKYLIKTWNMNNHSKDIDLLVSSIKDQALKIY